MGHTVTSTIEKLASSGQRFKRYEHSFYRVATLEILYFFFLGKFKFSKASSLPPINIGKFNAYN